MYDIIPIERSCKICKEIFIRTGYTQKWCLDCSRKQGKLRDRKKALRYARIMRLSILEKFGSVCRLCGYKDDLRALAIDHIHGGGHQELKPMSRTGYYRYLLNNGTHENYQTLCYNCNAIKGQTV